MFWTKQEKYTEVLTSDVQLRRDQYEEMRKQQAKEDADAVQRSLSYEPPVRVVKGKYNEFLEVGPFNGKMACVPLHLIAGVTIQYAISSLRYYSPKTNPSDIASLVIEMESGTKHAVSVEVACAELLLEAVNQVWREPYAAPAAKQATP